MNQFEKLALEQVAAKKLSEERQIELATTREREKLEEEARLKELIELYNLNKARRETTSGSKPGELWGEEVQQLCDEFLEFAGSVAIEGMPFPNARLLKPQAKKIEYETGSKKLFSRQPITKTKIIKSDWSIGGYGIAYTESLIQEKSGSGSDIWGSQVHMSTNHIRKEFSTKPDFDVYLCVDGLIRVNTHPVNLANLGGELKVPKVGEFKSSSDTRTYEESNIGAQDSVEMSTVRINTVSRAFKESDPVLGIRNVLGSYAGQMLLKTENT